MGIANRQGTELNPAALGFVLTVAVAWLTVERLTPGPPSPTSYIIFWSLTSALGGWWTLTNINFFKFWRPLPPFGDFLILLAALPIPALFFKYLLFGAVGWEKVRYRDILIGVPWVAMWAYGYHYFNAWLLLRDAKRQLLLAVLLPEEKEELYAELRARKLHYYLEPADCEERTVFGKERSLIVISRTAAREFAAHVDIIHAHLRGHLIIDNRQLLAELRGRISLEKADLWSYLLSATQQTMALRFYSQIKLLIEPLTAALLFILLSPVLALVAIGIKLTSPGPVFFCQLREGYLGKPFYMIKFRSMRQDAERNQAVWASPNDERMTPFGRFLRASRLDEIPQLWNIMRSEMCFVGPRPERPEFYESLKKEIPLFSLRKMVRPGITGWAQVRAGYAASVAESLKKLEFDLYYIQNMSPRLDILILLHTVSTVIFGDGRNRLLSRGSQVLSLRRARLRRTRARKAA